MIRSFSIDKFIPGGTKENLIGKHIDEKCKCGTHLIIEAVMTTEEEGEEVDYLIVKCGRHGNYRMIKATEAEFIFGRGWKLK